MKMIAISREYGSYGTSVAKAVSEKLGIEYYDKDIIRQAVMDSGMEYDYLSSHGEGISFSESLIRKITPISYDLKDDIYNIQKDVILRIAAKGPCIIIGRCADVILREAGFDSLNVFLHSSKQFRAERVKEILGETDPEVVKKKMKKIDHERRAFYEYFSGHKWGDYNNYDLILDVGRLGLDFCVDIICEAADR